MEQSPQHTFTQPRRLSLTISRSPRTPPTSSAAKFVAYDDDVSKREETPQKKNAITYCLSVDDQDLVSMLAECDGTSGGCARRHRRAHCRLSRRDERHLGDDAHDRLPDGHHRHDAAAGVIRTPGADPQELVVPIPPLLAELRRRDIVPEFTETPLA